MWHRAFFEGLGMGGGLIVAIGAQNAFLLKQGVQGYHLVLCALACALCDILLIVLGASSVGRFISGHPDLLGAIRVAGTLFLLEYGRRAAMAAWRGPAYPAPSAPAAAATRGSALRTAIALSLLNPHAWLDTVVLLGAFGAAQPGQGRYYFSAGAILASVLWFASLALGARLLAPLLARRQASRVLDALIAATMWTIALSLIIYN